MQGRAALHAQATPFLQAALDQRQQVRAGMCRGRGTDGLLRVSPRNRQQGQAAGTTLLVGDETVGGGTEVGRQHQQQIGRAGRVCTGIGLEPLAAVDDLFQVRARARLLAQLRVGTQGDRQRGIELGLGQLALGLVVVDVVLADGLDLGRIPGLAGAQDDACAVQAEFAPDPGDDVQAGGGCLHHHVEQHHGNVRLHGQHAQGLGARMRVQQLQRTVRDLQLVQGEAGGLVHLVVVIDHQDAPGLGQRFGWRRLITKNDLDVDGIHASVCQRFHRTPIDRPCKYQAGTEVEKASNTAQWQAASVV